MLSDLAGTGLLLAYYVVFAFALPTVLKVAGVPTEWVRKTQHVVYSLSVFILLRLFSTWYWAVLAASVLAVIAYPLLWAIEKTPGYRRWFVDRTAHGGELRRQLIYVQLTFAVLLFIFWGLLGTRWHYVVAAAVMAWGFGDAAAAVFGKAFGRRRFIHRLIENGKTFVGTGAMISAAGVALFFTLLLYAGKPWYLSLLVSVLVAPVCGIVELFSRKGTDTLTVPLAAALAILSLVWLLGPLGM